MHLYNNVIYKLKSGISLVAITNLESKTYLLDALE